MVMYLNLDRVVAIQFCHHDVTFRFGSSEAFDVLANACYHRMTDRFMNSDKQEEDVYTDTVDEKAPTRKNAARVPVLLAQKRHPSIGILQRKAIKI